ncbi:Acetyl-coenzyme A synthetase 2-like, mitochondrial [Phytophthora pseudosyringae]|uniref:acetate--CoA ligase n=1 Tax=Phytophthora pseudosyringae TaxID=221518 RepID=A0A8T1VHJ8_9STRA|nr:Acetyl-coenzyme A synthetase 2-like, mitochondrial [Phytophthora pseudosyringae]
MGDSAGVSVNGEYPPFQELAKTAHIKNFEQYEAMYKRSLEDPESFWGELARENLDWFRDFDQSVVGTVNKGDVAWFLNGQINVSVNCIDRHVKKHADKVAIIWEADEIGEGREITYTELLEETCRVANAMKHAGVKKGDTVAIYMPMIPEIAFVMLACTRIGAVHSVVFAGFSADALRDRLIDANTQWVFTSDEGKRGGRTLPLKQIVDVAVDGLDFVRNVFVFKRTRNLEVKMNPKIDIDMDDEMKRHRPYCAAEFMNAEDLMFILYTSGSTGAPKGIAHTTAGYLLVVAEAAVIGIPHRIKGEGICCFVTLVEGVKPSKDVEKELVQQVRAHIGAFASPDLIVLVPGLPKTRSGKIMRRVLRKISHGEEDSLGDVSTLADPSVVPILITNTKAALVGNRRRKRTARSRCTYYFANELIVSQVLRAPRRLARVGQRSAGPGRTGSRAPGDRENLHSISEVEAISSAAIEGLNGSRAAQAEEAPPSPCKSRYAAARDLHLESILVLPERVFWMASGRRGETERPHLINLHDVAMGLSCARETLAREDKAATRMAPVFEGRFLVRRGV